MSDQKRNRKERFLRLLSTAYLLASLLALGRVCALRWPKTVEAARSFLGGRTAEVFSALTDALGEGRDVREAFLPVDRQ